MLDGALDPTATDLRVVEQGRAEDHSQGHTDLIARRAERLGQRGDQLGRDRVDLGDEGPDELGAEELGAGGLLEQDRRDVVAVEPAGVAQDRFLAVVVLCGDLAKPTALDEPAGEGAGGLLDVALGVMAPAQGEQLHHLAGKVFIRMRLAVGRRIEPDQHRRVPGDRRQERREAAQGVGPQQVVLALHQGRCC